jgi:hypothetical protein
MSNRDLLKLVLFAVRGRMDLVLEAQPSSLLPLPLRDGREGMRLGENLPPVGLVSLFGGLAACFR